jgi:mannose-6-phosphate isomerase-like protein (cupin superfamily)
MSDWTRLNLLGDVEARSPGEGIEARFARGPLGLEHHGLTTFSMGPGARFPFGHRHREQEEIFVVLEGTLTANLDGEHVRLGRHDAVRIGPPTWRCFEAGPEGALVLVTGAPRTPAPDHEIECGWWPEG